MLNPTRSIIAISIICLGFCLIDGQRPAAADGVNECDPSFDCVPKTLPGQEKIEHRSSDVSGGTNTFPYSYEQFKCVGMWDGTREAYELWVDDAKNSLPGDNEMEKALENKPECL